MAKQFKVVKAPSDLLSLTNCAIANDSDFTDGSCILLTNGGSQFLFGIKTSNDIGKGELGFGLIQRKWAALSLTTTVEVSSHVDKKMTQYLSSVAMEADFLQRAKATQNPYNTDTMATDVSVAFKGMPFTVNQPIVFSFKQNPYLVLTVKSVQVADMKSLSGRSADSGGGQPTQRFGIFKIHNSGILMPNTSITFGNAENSSIVLTGKSRGTSAMPSIINPDWDFSKMGVGGLDKEFSGIFRRAFASRVFPPDVVDQLGLKHVKGILLYGPPGTGKTLMARQIGGMLNAREPKIVNGPEILNKYVGESEANVRKLFEDAENEQKKAGINSGLHMIIFDEIDAICKTRGSLSGSTGVQDTVVNQLLSKIDGVEQLNNILIIGMTNRKDLIDEALLRPGRLEVQMEIGLPDEEGRVQILDIHTAKLRDHDKLASDVSVNELALSTKNFSGAEIEGLVRAATTTAMNRLVKVEGTVVVDPEAVDTLKVTRDDFMLALNSDIKAAFGASSEDFQNYVANGVIMYGQPVQHVIDDGRLLIQQTRCGNLVSPVSVLFEGIGGSGKTALAANLAISSKFPFVKICSPENMIGFNEGSKCQAIKKVFDDAYKSELSCIVVDDIERLIEYVPIGPRFSNTVLQALMVLLKRKLPKGKKLLIIGTTSSKDVLDQMQMTSVFNTVIHIASITEGKHVMKILQDLNYFDNAELKEIENGINESRICIGIKKLISLVEMSVQMEKSLRAYKFLSLLNEQ